MEDSQLVLGSGLFLGTWTLDIASRKLYADSGIADFLGIARGAARAGAAREEFDRTVVPEHLPKLKGAVKTAIHNGSALAVGYQVETPRYGRQWLIAKGKCYRVRREPAFLTGHTVCFHDVGRSNVPQHIIAHCDAILSLVDEKQEPMLRYLIEMARDAAMQIRRTGLPPVASQGTYDNHRLRKEQNISAIFSSSVQE